MRLQVSISTLGRAALGAAILATTTLPVSAAISDKSLSYTFNHFHDVDGLNVYTHYSGTSVTLSPKSQVVLEWVHDMVVFPAIDAAPGSQEAIDAITTASRPINSESNPFQDFVKVRNSIEGSANLGRASAGYYVSTESDYFAQMISTG